MSRRDFLNKLGRVALAKANEIDLERSFWHTTQRMRAVEGPHYGFWVFPPRSAAEVANAYSQRFGGDC